VGGTYIDAVFFASPLTKISQVYTKRHPYFRFWHDFFLFLPNTFTKATTMKQTVFAPDTLPQQFSPDFNSWLDNEKAEARRHRQRLVKFGLIAISACVLFLIKDGVWVREVLDVANFIAQP
jgi:hypothetical protein